MKTRVAMLAALAAAGCGPSFDTTGPRITEGPLASVVRDTTATVVWITNERANSLVEYGPTDSYGTVEIDNLYLETHVVTIKNLEPETVYHLRAKSYDLFGNGPVSSSDIEIETLAPQPAPQIAISEIMSSPVATTGEYLELHNYGLDDIDLTGFTFTDGDSVDTLQAFNGSSTLLAGGDYAMILDSDYVEGTYSIPGGVVLMTTADSSLGNGLSDDDPITLFAPGQSTPTSTYGTPEDAFDSLPLDPATGISVERISTVDPDEVGNWCFSIDPDGSTPGEENSPCT